MKENMTGYASIDMPWLKEYSDKDKEISFPKMSMKEYLYKCNKNNENLVAINYFGRKITYKELFQKIEETKKSLKNMGIKNNDVVSIASPFLPEVVYSIYAINALGGVVNLVDPRVPSSKLINYFKGSNTKFLIMYDGIYGKVKEIEKDYDIEKSVLISPLNSLPIGMKCLGELKNIIQGNKIDVDNKKYVKWNDFIKDGKVIDYVVDDEAYTYEKPAIIVYTSGTSGEPKGAISSNESFNNIALSQSISLTHTKTGDKFLLIMPPFIAYGLAIGLHGQLCRGQELQMVPTFTIDNQAKMLGDLVSKYKPQTIMGVPTFMVDLIKHPKMQKLDCTFLKDIIVGGDSMNVSAEEKVNNFFIAKNSEARIKKGWGLTEVNSAFSYTKDESSNKLGSVGIPLIGNNIKIVKPVEKDIINFDELEEVKYNEIGEIFINSKSTIIDYLNNEEESKKVFFIDKNGNRWVRTKDLGRITEDGLIYIEGRMKRIIIRPDGHNISPFAIENIINKNENVENCAVVGTPATNSEHGSYATAYIELKKEHKKEQIEILKELKKEIESKLPPRDVASDYKFVDEIPLTNIGKVNYKILEEQEKKLVLRNKK